DAIELNIAGDFTNDSSEAGADVLIRADAPNSNGNGTPNIIDSNGNPAVVPYDCRFVPFGEHSCDTPPAGYNPRYISYATFLDLSPADSQAPFKPASVPIIQHLDSYGAQGTIDWALSDAFQLKSISSWREYQSSWAQDVDGSPLASQQLL